jgi:hypothetical protein
VWDTPVVRVLLLEARDVKRKMYTTGYSMFFSCRKRLAG